LLALLAGQAVEEDTHQGHQALQLQGKVLLEELEAQAGLHLMPLAGAVQLPLAVMVEQMQVMVARVQTLTQLGQRQHLLVHRAFTLVEAEAQWSLVVLTVLVEQVAVVQVEALQQRLAL
jgi:hypothetical protein